MLVVAPKPIDQTLLHKIIYELPLLYQKQHYPLLVLSIFSYILFELFVEVTPVEATHALDTVCKVIRRCYI